MSMGILPYETVNLGLLDSVLDCNVRNCQKNEKPYIVNKYWILFYFPHLCEVCSKSLKNESKSLDPPAYPMRPQAYIVKFLFFLWVSVTVVPNILKWAPEQLNFTVRFLKS
jgi:hypothetical protein